MQENMIKTFTNMEFGSLRSIMINDEPYFIGKEIAEILGYANPKNAVPKHVDAEDKLSTQIEYAGQKRSITVINESGLYSLILSSKLPKAKQFKRWVTSEVLPTIRKTGGYVSNDDLFINTYLPFADEPTKLLFRTTLTTINQLNAKIERDKPLVEFAEHIQVSDDCISMNDMAKVAAKNGINIGRNRLFDFLRKQKILNTENVPYQRYIENQPWFQVKESIIYICGKPEIKMTTQVTPKGQMGILKKLRKLYV